jgi:vancomycin resistance protein VanJ
MTELGAAERRRDVGAALRRSVVAAAAVGVALATAVELALWIGMPVSGLPGLVQIAAPHIALAGLTFAPFALIRGSGPLRLALLVLLVVSVARFGGEWLSPLGAGGGEADLTVTTWSLEVGPGVPAQVVEALRADDADVVVVQELSRPVASALATDPILTARYPHRVLDSEPHGLGILSRLPLEPTETIPDLPVQLARLQVGSETIELLNGHPLPGVLGREIAGIPTGYDPTRRDERIDAIRRLIDSRIEAGARLIVAGDFNTASSERAFERLTAGLRDAHEEVGWGPGWTWRPNRLVWLPGGILRLDIVLTGPGLEPVGPEMTCTDTAEHCLFTAGLRLARAEPSD